jgi:preprotein translocase subunit SecB
MTMADNDNIASAIDPNKQVLLTRIYIKDCSFESPRAPAVFSSALTPDVKVDMRTTHAKLEGDNYEVVLAITAEAIAENRSVFLVEVHQAGLFIVRGFGDRDIGPILGSYCPGILFPYARSAVSDLVMKGSMPMLLLQPVNFDAVYAQSLANAAGAGDPPA